MSTLRKWALRRRIYYGTGFLCVLVLMTSLVYRVYFYAPGDCFDTIANQDERGVDCGGSCVRICATDAIMPRIIWAESFEIIVGQYNAVAYVENSNQVAATPELVYTLQLFDGNDLVAERKGKTVLPPNSIYPIFEGRIDTNGSKVTRTVLTLEPPELWVPGINGREQFEVSNVNLTGADSKPRLDAVIKNTALTPAEKVEVVVTLFNDAGKPILASQTFIDYLAERSSKDIVFTWPNSIAKTVRSCLVPSDVVLVLDRSGSMAADGGTPPEPLESAKKAAQSFSNFLQPKDTLGYLSYATTPTTPMEQTLTNNFAQVQSAVSSTVMGTGGVQYTNMGEAFSSATAELISERHRADARKVIVFMTDGDVTRPINPDTGLQDREYAGNYAKEKASLAKKENVTIYTIGFGDSFGESGGDVTRDISLIKDLASDPSYYYEAPTATQLQEVYQQIAESICESGTSKIEVIAKTPTNFTPLEGN